MKERSLIYIRIWYIGYEMRMICWFNFDLDFIMLSCLKFNKVLFFRTSLVRIFICFSGDTITVVFLGRNMWYIYEKNGFVRFGYILWYALVKSYTFSVKFSQIKLILHLKKGSIQNCIFSSWKTLNQFATRWIV